MKEEEEERFDTEISRKKVHKLTERRERERERRRNNLNPNSHDCCEEEDKFGKSRPGS